MNFFTLFKIKSTNADMVSDTQFIAMPIGETLKKNNGDEYIKTDTNVFDKVQRSIRSDTENDNRYPQLTKGNVFDGTNIFNAGIKVSGNIKSDNIENSGDIFTGNLTATDNIKGNALEITGDSDLNDVHSNSIVNDTSVKTKDIEADNAKINENLEVDGYIRSQGSITTDNLLQGRDLAISNNANIKDIHSNSIVNDTSIETNTLEVDGTSDLNDVTFTNANGNSLSITDFSTENIISKTITNSAKITTNTFESANNVKINGTLTVGGNSTVQDLSAKNITGTNATLTNDATIGNNLSVVGNINSTNITNVADISTSTLSVTNSAKVLSISPSSPNTGSVGLSTSYYATAYIKAINGDTFSGVSLKAKHADLAEIYSADKLYECGTVLQVSHDPKYQAEEFHGGTLLGAVSTYPGITLNETAKGVEVALKGMIPVKCIGKVYKGQYCIAKDGKVYGVYKQDMTLDLLLNCLGVAIEDSGDEKVIVKV